MATQFPIEMEAPTHCPKRSSTADEDTRALSTRDDLNRIVERTIQREEPTQARFSTAIRFSIPRLPRSARRPHVLDFAVSLVMATQPNTPSAHPLTASTSATGLRHAAPSPRRMRPRLRPDERPRPPHIDDIRTIAHAVLRHRIILNRRPRRRPDPRALLPEIVAAAKGAAAALALTNSHRSWTSNCSNASNA